MEHAWELVCISPIAGDGNSRNIFDYCPQCGTLRFDYRYGEDNRSPNYPLYFTTGGRVGAYDPAPPCVPVVAPDVHSDPGLAFEHEMVAHDV